MVLEIKSNGENQSNLTVTEYVSFKSSCIWICETKGDLVAMKSLNEGIKLDECEVLYVNK